MTYLIDKLCNDDESQASRGLRQNQQKNGWGRNKPSMNEWMGWRKTDRCTNRQREEET